MEKSSPSIYRDVHGLSFKTNKQRKGSKMTTEFFKISKPDFAFALWLVTEVIRKFVSQMKPNYFKKIFHLYFY